MEQDDYFELFYRKCKRAPQDFSGHNVIQTFTATEKIPEEVLSIVPFCKEHETVWSHRLATVLLEAGSQIDSLWRFEALQNNSPKRRNRKDEEIEWNIQDFFSFYGQNLAPKWAVFFGGESPQLIAPFKNWRNLPGYNYTEYKTLDWWQSYTALKHDRLANHKQATLAASVDVVAALFLAIVRCGYCDEYMLQVNWVTCNSFGHNDGDKIDDFPADNQAVIESKLFSYSPGLWKGIDKICSYWKSGDTSERFRLWFADYYKEQYKIRGQPAK
jgi:hypothetical protein